MSELLNLYRAHHGKVSDRWSSYLAQYDRFLHAWRDKDVRLLEIGIQNGGSLEIWGRYFRNATRLVGCDVDPLCANLRYEDPRIAVVVADASSDEGFRQVQAKAEAFDIVIDDGSHRSSHIVQAFARYFPLVADGGMFIAEDLHCSYWKEFEGGLAYPFSSIAFFKLLVDVVNKEHWGVAKSARDLLAKFEQQYACEFRESDLQQVHSVEFVNSMCVVRKRPNESNLLGPRLIVGEDEQVSSGAKRYDGSTSVALDQSANIWSTSGLDASGQSAQDSDLVRALLRIEALEQEVAKAREDSEAQERHWQQRTQHLGARLEQLGWQEQGMEELLRAKDAQIAELLLAQRTYSARAARLVARSAQTLFPVGSKSRVLLTKALRASEGAYRRTLGHGSLAVEELPMPPVRPTEGATVRPDAKAVPEDFAQWIAAFEPSESDLRHRSESAPAYSPESPLFSIILPVYRVPGGVLRATMSSLSAQTWKNWEVCVAFADEADSENHRILQELAASESRIRILVLAENGGISRNSNAALEIARGEFLALLDHDDELTPWALHDMADAIARHPTADFLYSDKDSINADGTVRQHPLFKPDWSPEMLYSVNYLTHLNVMRRSCVKQVGGWRPETDGAQDWDIFIRVAEVAREIRRVPGVGYHWRIIEGSTSTGIGAKPYAASGQLRTLQDWVRRQKLPAWVNADPESGFRVNWRIPAQARIDVIIYGNAGAETFRSVAANVKEELGDHLGSVSIVRRSSSADPVFAGDDGVQEFAYAEHADLGKTIAEAARSGTGSAITLIDVASRHWLPSSIREISAWALLHPHIGFAAPLLLESPTVVVEAGRILGAGSVTQPLFHGSPLRHWGPLGGPLWYRNVSAASPAALSIKRSAWNGQDFEAGPWTHAAAMMCRRIRDSGLRGVVTPYARVYVARLAKEEVGEYDPQFATDPYFHPFFQSVIPLRLKTTRGTA
jgi:hypothetical protein